MPPPEQHLWPAPPRFWKVCRCTKAVPPWPGSFRPAARRNPGSTAGRGPRMLGPGLRARRRVSGVAGRSQVAGFRTLLLSLRVRHPHKCNHAEIRSPPVGRLPRPASISCPLVPAQPSSRSQLRRAKPVANSTSSKLFSFASWHSKIVGFAEANWRSQLREPTANSTFSLTCSFCRAECRRAVADTLQVCCVALGCSTRVTRIFFMSITRQYSRATLLPQTSIVSQSRSAALDY